MKKLVSVYIPTYNRIELLKRAVSSVLKQTYQNFEIIIVDDNSSDGTREYLKKLSQENDKIKIHLKEKNTGACASRNIAVRMAKGYYVTGLDDDDYFHSKRLETLVKCFDNRYSFITTNFFKVSGNGINRSSLRGRVINLPLLFNRNAVGNQVFVKRDYLLSITGFDEALFASQDLDTWIRLIKKYGKAKRLKDCLYYMDISHDSPRISVGDKRIKGTHQFIEKYADELKPSQIRYLIDSTGRKHLLSKTKKLFRFIYAYNPEIIFETILNKIKLG